MSSVKSTFLDDPDIGKPTNTFFKPTNQKQRIALIPHFVTVKELLPTEEMRADQSIPGKQKVAQMLTMASELKKATEDIPKRVLSYSVDGEPGYLYCRQDVAMVHYDQTLKYYFCKAEEYKALGRVAECCKKSKTDAIAAGKPDQGDAVRLYGFVVLAYGVDSTGNVIMIPEAQRKILDDGTVFRWDYMLSTWAVNDSKIREIKQFTKKFPPVSYDYEVWTEKKGAADVVKFAPCPESIWQMDSKVMAHILKKSVEIWTQVGRTLGKDLTITQIDQMAGVQQAPVAAKTEINYTQLLGGG